MTLRENVMAILNYQSFDHFPVVAFGYWGETVLKWAEEGHLTREEAEGWCKGGDRSYGDRAIMKRLGFDFNWQPNCGFHGGLKPAFEPTILEEKPDGSQVLRDENGLIVLIKPGVNSIPAEIGTSMTDRESWEELYLPKLQWDDNRVGVDWLKSMPALDTEEVPRGLHCGSLLGAIRNLLGVQQLSYLYVDDEDLFAEIIDTFGNLAYQGAKVALETGAKFDYAHFWEDICFKNGPLVSPSVFAEYVGPHYRKIASLLKEHGVDIVSVDCDGLIDHLLPVWLENGVNTMFPIEVGTWEASIGPWRAKYGKELRGVGGMNKNVFAMDYAAVDREIERLKPLMAMGGYIPCPDHRIPPDAKFENVQYYCDKMQNLKL